MAIKIFGFTFGSDVTPNIDTPIAPDSLNTNIDISTAAMGGWTSPTYTALDLEQNAQTENEYIVKYRDVSYFPEVDSAIDEIAAEAIITDKTESKAVDINLDKAEELPEQVKELMQQEFDFVYNMLRFDIRGHDIFRRWYIDGRLNYQVLIDDENPQAGIQEIRYIDPRKIKRVRELVKAADPGTGAQVIKGVKEYFLYSDRGVNSLQNTVQTGVVTFTKDSIVHVNSGLYDPQSNIVVSYLHKALRPAANLRMMEDAIVINRIVRAPDRRVFYIDTGSLPKAKADQYIQEIANKYRNKIVYDSATGEIRNDRRYLSMQEDYWIPRKDGNAATEIDTLPGASNTSDIEDVEYFKDKLYKSLYVPGSRFSDQPSVFGGSATEITRDELRFSRFISRVRTRFAGLFEELLERQCILKGIMTAEDFNQIRSKINYVFAEDNYFAEANEYAVIQQRMNIIATMDQYVGKYVSKDYIFKNVLQLDDEEVQKMKEQMEMDREEELQQQIMQQQEMIKAGIAPNPQEVQESFDMDI